MVSIKNNKSWWESWDWDLAGDEWSLPWGNADSQWYGSLFPRIHHFLPAGSVLEIACGFGRWTQYLKDHCAQLTAVDLADNCIAACKDRFADAEHVRFATNDGRTLPDVADASIDFAFSFDSLVHADKHAMASYLAELHRVLKSGGVAFLHHSNLGVYANRDAQIGRVPRLTGALLRSQLLDYSHLRDPGVDAQFIATEASNVGLQCIGQEVIPWLARRRFIDCISVIVRADGPAARPNIVVRNRQFNREPAYVARLHSVYAPLRRASLS